MPCPTPKIPSDSRFGEQILSWIIRRDFFQVLHQVAHALVGRLRDDNLYFGVLVATGAIARAGHTLFLEAQSLAAVCSRGNANERAAVNRGHFDLGAESGFSYGHGDFGVQIVAATLEKGMWLDVHAKVQIARRRAHGARVAFAGDADARAAGHARGNAHVDGFRTAQASIPAAGRTHFADFARSTTARAGNVELHLSGSLLNGPGAVTGRTGLRGADRASAVTGLAGIQPGDSQFLDGTADSVPKIDFDLILEVAAGLVLRLGADAAPTSKKLTEEIAETSSATLRARTAAKVKAAEIEVDAARVVRMYGAARTAGRD